MAALYAVAARGLSAAACVPSASRLLLLCASSALWLLYLLRPACPWLRYMPAGSVCLVPSVCLWLLCVRLEGPWQALQALSATSLHGPGKPWRALRALGCTL